MSSIRQELLRMPPERAGALGPDGLASPQAVRLQVVGVASTAAIDTGIDSAGARVNKQNVTFVTDQDIFICFGESDVGAASSSDLLLKAADEPRTWLIDSRRTRYFRAIRAGAVDANLRFYVSG